MMMKMVEPYMTIMSPGLVTPTLSASAAASMVPAITGVPAASPVSRAAFARHLTGDVGRPQHFRQPVELDDVGASAALQPFASIS